MWRVCILALALLLAMPSLARAADSAVILMYHRFGDGRFPATNTTLEQLDAHIAELKSGGFTVMKLPDLLDAMQAGKPLPERAVALTIDDAWVSAWTHAWPRFKAAGFPFTLFVVTDESDRRTGEYMTWAQIRELATSGLVTIGTQGAAHPHMAVLPRDAIAKDFARANARIAAETGVRPDLLAWPFGEASREAMEVAREAGYRAAFGQHSGVAWRGEPQYYLPRFAMNETYGGPDRFRTAIRALPLRVIDLSPNDPKLGENPPRFKFTLTDDTLPGLDRLACYASNAGQVPVERRDREVRVTLATPFPKGRGRINCTAPAPGGRWQWLGWQYVIP